MAETYPEGAKAGTRVADSYPVGVAAQSYQTFTQTYSTASATVAAATVVAPATTAATQTVPYGYAGAAQADAIPVAIVALIADVLALRKNINAIIDVLQAAGISA